MDMSGDVDSVVLDLPHCAISAASYTPTTTISMPSLVTINLKDGRVFIIDPPELMGDEKSQARDVMGGNLEGTTTQCLVVVKIQVLARWHDKSNGHEYQLANGAWRLTLRTCWAVCNASMYIGQAQRLFQSW